MNGQHGKTHESETVPVKIVSAELQRQDPLPVRQVNATLREAVLNWLLQQGVSTVLLLLILVALGYGVPNYVVPAIQKGYEQNSKSLERSLEMSITARDRELKVIMEAHDRDREAFRDAMRMPRQP